LKGEIFAIGTELLMGELNDTNSPYIARELSLLGITVDRVTQIGDNLIDLAESFSIALTRSDCIFTTGGLGPTQDDLTRESIALALGEKTTVSSKLLEELEDWFKARDIKMPERNIKQALLIPSARSISNKMGTAPGWFIEHNEKIIVAMPGPPDEMQNIWVNQVLPLIKAKIEKSVILTKTIKTLGLSEAEVAERVARFFLIENPSLGIYAKQDGIHLRIISRAATNAEAMNLMRAVEEGIAKALGPHIWGYDDDTPGEMAGRALRDAGVTIASMESCTGGLLSSVLTDVPGSSAYFKGSLVCYDVDSKLENGIPENIISNYGVISPETALAMAKAAKLFFKTDIGIGVTGVAGPGKQERKPAGTVFSAISMEGNDINFAMKLPPSRPVVKYRAVSTILVELTKMLSGR
jgi:nicotinamide-nucleotide amidase